MSRLRFTTARSDRPDVKLIRSGAMRPARAYLLINLRMLGVKRFTPTTHQTRRGYAAGSSLLSSPDARRAEIFWSGLTQTRNVSGSQSIFRVDKTGRLPPRSAPFFGLPRLANRAFTQFYWIALRDPLAVHILSIFKSWNLQQIGFGQVCSKRRPGPPSSATGTTGSGDHVPAQVKRSPMGRRTPRHQRRGPGSRHFSQDLVLRPEGVSALRVAGAQEGVLS